MSILIKNGIVVNPAGTMTADVLTSGGRVSVAGQHSLNYKSDTVIDAAGMYILPGGIDPHVHMHLPTAAGYSSDDFRSGSSAALFGGTTTIIDFVTPEKDEPLPVALEKRMKEAASSLTDYSFHVSPVGWRNSTPDEINECIRMGVTSFKVYMAYKKTIGLDDEDIYKVMTAVGKSGGIVMVHCETGDEIENLRDRYYRNNQTGPLYHALSRPANLEAAAVKKAIELAAKADCPLYIVHVSSKESLNHIRQARTNGQAVYAETCPQYLLLDDSRYKGTFRQTAPYVMSPPLRTTEDNQAIWEALADGTLNTVGTDHCPFTMAQKETGKEDFRKIPGGAGGVEHRLSLLYTYGVLTNRLTFNQIVNLYSSAPAAIFGLSPQKGIMTSGSDADLVIWNPEPENVISVKSHRMNCDINIYDGFPVKGRVEYVIRDGKVVIENERAESAASPGKYLFRTAE
jgi:dihydropyrimidinase